MEFFTLRGGTRFSRGHTVVAGLGLGHQLREVTHRKQVKRVTLIERSQSLLDFIMPALKPLLGPAPVEITNPPLICGGNSHPNIKTRINFHSR